MIRSNSIGIVRDPGKGQGPLLEARGLQAWFPSTEHLFGWGGVPIYAVRDISFELARGTFLAVLGESGCGKTTLLRTLLRLVPNTSGSLVHNGVAVSELRGGALRAFRRQLAMVAQHVGAGLDPKIRVGDVLEDAVLRGEDKVRAVGSSTEGVLSFKQQILEAMVLGDELLGRFPHELSQGQRQRVVLAKALLTRPEIILLDEPVSSLDVTVKLRTLSLIKKFTDSDHLSGIMFTHDLESAKFLADHVMVIYLGKVMEFRKTGAFFEEPHHPYSHALIVGAGMVRSERGIVSPANALRGEPADPANPPSGCLFSSRCPNKEPICEREEPALKELGQDHRTACHFSRPWPLS